MANARGYRVPVTGDLPDLSVIVPRLADDVAADVGNLAAGLEALGQTTVLVDRRSLETQDLARASADRVATLAPAAESALTAANLVSAQATAAKADSALALTLAKASAAPIDGGTATLVRTPASDTAKALAEGFAAVEAPERHAAGAAVTTTHITAAMAAAATSGHPVVIRPGTYVGNLTIPDGVTVQGAGIGETIITGRLSIGSRVVLRDLTAGVAGSQSTFSNNADGSVIERVHFKGGSAAANFYLNDSRATNHRFLECLFTDNTTGGNGIQIVDKGTEANHYENIVFERCQFRANARMNFEIIQRSNAGQPVVLGYRSIDLVDCIFGPTTTINVSYDSGLLADGSARSSGYSTVRGCEITGGSYGLELAGAIGMRIEDNDIRDQTGYMLSSSQVGAAWAGHIIRHNRFIGTQAANDVTFQGLGSIIDGNYIKTPGRFRFVSAGDCRVSGNYVDCSSFTAVSLESAFNNQFIGNTILGGTSQTVLVIYPASVNNSFVGNYLYQVNGLFDLRDGVLVHRSGNIIKRTTNAPVVDDFLEYVLALPTAGNNYRGKTFMVRGAVGAADQTYICLKSAADTYSWKPVITG